MNKFKITTTVLLVGLFSLVRAQVNNPGYFSNTHTLESIGSLVNNIPSLSPNTFVISPVDKAVHVLRENNKLANLLLKLDLGTDYVAVPGATFSIELPLVITAGTTNITRTLKITQDKPEELQNINLLGTISGVGSISVQVTAPSGIPSSAGLLQNYINHNLRLTTTLVREYNVDVRLNGSLAMSSGPSVAAPSASGRRVSFSWTPSSAPAYTNYELQILRLYNNDEAYKNDLIQIRSNIDWSRALRVETQSSNAQIDLTIAEGTGFYIWRVRPIGTYFEGGIGNSENYGNWSYSSADNSTELFNKNILTSSVNPTPYAFYFTDPDENINWIYSRTFTEGDNVNQPDASGTKINEGINYADGLLRARQSQSYNSSNNTTVVSQTVSDYSGRPALTTLPVPVNAGLTGYKVGFVKTNTGNLYTAASYDTDPNNPSTIKDDATSAFSYYSNTPTVLNTDANNNNVPNAEGYAFKRTVFKTDGTGRVTEESGVGKVHSLGTITNGSVRTTRILYGTPSDDELIRIFGEEAPLAESVIKTTTIDPNNVVSVSYTSKEGKTIATALISVESDNLDHLEKSPIPLSVSNVADQNVVSNGKFISSRRINVPSDGTSITLNYDLGGMPSASAGCAGGGCNFKLKFYLINIKTGVTYTSDADNSVPGFQSFDASSGSFTFPANWSFRPKTSAPVINHNSATNNITLDAGEYMFIKEVYSDNDENYAANLVNTQTSLYQPILDAIAVKMVGATSTAGYNAFLDFMSALSSQIVSYGNGTATPYYQASDHAHAFPITSPPVTTAVLLNTLGITLGTEVPLTYEFPYDFVLNPIAQTSGPTTEMSFSTGCCSSITTQIPKPEICFVCDGAPNISSPVTSLTDMISSITTSTGVTDAERSTAHSQGNEVLYGVEDIFNSSDYQALPNDAAKRAAIDPLVQYYFIDLLTDKMEEEQIPQSDLYKIAPGFTLEGMKFMISNMLISKYFTGNAIKNTTDGLWYTSVKNPVNGVWEQTTTLVSSVVPERNYKCKDLLTCWTDAVNLLNSFGNSDDVNMVSAFNEQDGENSAQNEGEDDNNYEEMSKRQKKKLKKKIGKELEDFSNSDDGRVPKSRIDAMTSLVANFMDCAGYQFAAVIDGDNLPGYITSTDSKFPDEYKADCPSCRTPLFGTPAQDALIHASMTLGSETFTGIPVLFESSPGGPAAYPYTCGGTPGQVLAYPYIVKPEWMFKYFVYNVWHNNISGDFIDDKDVLIPNQVLVDMKQGYNTAKYYLSTITPSPPMAADTCNYTFDLHHLHVNWSMDDRLVFYKEIKGAAACYIKKGYEPGALTPPIDPGCGDKCELIHDANAELDSYVSDCQSKRPAIKAALTAQLLAACYKIVECQRTTDPGQVTDREIDLMVEAVIQDCLTKIGDIRAKLPAADGSFCGASTYGYGCSLSEYPIFEETACSEILLQNDNTLIINPNSSINIQLFADCDQQLLSALSSGTFLPFIQTYTGVGVDPNCAAISRSKEWQSCSPTGCNGNQTNCTGPEANFTTYTAEQTVTPTP